MAFIHTNFLTGNDTTGDGTTSLPYKTVFKAISVAASSDTIKVAGGQWSANLAGTFTFTQGSNVVTTSVSQVGTVLVDDILSFEDGQFGFDKFHIKVMAVSAGSITTALFWPMATTTVSDVKRLDAYHYSQATTSPAQFEAWSTTDVQPNGRTGITISGGWNSTFDTQNGWTVMRRTGQTITITNTTPTGFTFTASGGLGAWGTDLVWDRFMAHTINLWGSPGAGASFAVDEIALIKGQAFATQSSYVGLWQANPLVPAKWYVSTPGNLASMNSINANYSINTNRPDVFESEIWATISWTTANTSGVFQGNFGMFSSVGREGSVNQNNIHVRMNTHDYTAGGVTYASYPGSLSWLNTTAGNYVKSLTWYANLPSFVYLAVGNTSTTQIQDINVSGPYASQSAILFQASGGQFIVDLFDEGKTIDSFGPGQGSFFVANGAYTVAPLNQLCQTNLQTVQVKDIEGLKTLDYYNNIYFKENGDLKVSSATSFSSNSSTFYQWKLLGVVEKPTVPFVVTFVLKVDTGREAEWDFLGVQYGPNANQIITQALTPTDQYATYTVSVDPSLYSDWNKFSFPLYFGIRSKTANTYDLETMSYAYIQSISVV